MVKFHVEFNCESNTIKELSSEIHFLMRNVENLYIQEIPEKPDKSYDEVKLTKEFLKECQKTSESLRKETLL